MAVNPKMKDSSILLQILRQALDTSVDTDTAHNNLINYLNNSFEIEIRNEGGIESDEKIEIDRFHKSFQRVIQDSKVFGRVTTSSNDISLNLIHELTLRYQTANELKSRCVEIESMRMGDQWMKEYHELLLKEENIKKSITKLYQIRAHERTQTIVPFDERVTNYRRKYRAIKLLWNTTPIKSIPSIPEYSPLKREIYTSSDIQYGSFTSKKSAGINGNEFDLDNDGNVGNVGVIIDGYAIGFGVSSHHVNEVESTWITFQHLQDLSSLSNSSCLFPLPITTEYSEEFDQRNTNLTNTSIQFFIFEIPHPPSLVPFSSISGMSLAANLRKYPLVLKRWCSQLGAAYHELKNHSSSYQLSLPTLEDVFIAENGSLLLGNILSSTDNHSPSQCHQNFLEFVHSFLSNSLDLSRNIRFTLSSDSDALHGIKMSPSWNISSTSQEDILSLPNPYPLSHSLSISSNSSLFITLSNLPHLSHTSHSNLYPIYTPFNTSHHYYKFHMKRYHQRYELTRKQVRKAHYYLKNSIEMMKLPSKLGDLTSKSPSEGGVTLLNEGDVVVIYGDNTLTQSKIIQMTTAPSIKSNQMNDKECEIQIEAMNPGLTFVHFYLVGQINSTLSSHLPPDDQSIDFYPTLLRSHLQSDQFLSHLFTISIHVKDYQTDGTHLGTNELLSIIEMAMNSSINDHLPSKEVLLCSKYLLTKTTDLNSNEVKKQWKDLHLLLFDENPSLPPPLTEQEKETLLNERKERIDSLLEAVDGELTQQPTRKDKKQQNEIKAWKLGYN